jgi:hypothetical protein
LYTYLGSGNAHADKYLVDLERAQLVNLMGSLVAIMADL